MKNAPNAQLGRIVDALRALEAEVGSSVPVLIHMANLPGWHPAAWPRVVYIGPVHPDGTYNVRTPRGAPDASRTDLAVVIGG